MAASGCDFLCAAAFPGSHLCHYSEYAFTNSAGQSTHGRYLDRSFLHGRDCGRAPVFRNQL